MLRQSTNPILARVTRAALASSLALLAAAAPGASGPAAPQRGQVPITSAALFRRSYFKEATRDELLQFHNAIVDKGWRGASIAFVPTGYVRAASLQPDGNHFATLYGDIDGDQRPEWVVGYNFPPEEDDSPMEARTPAFQQHDDRARIVVFKKEAGRWRVSWRSPGLGAEFHTPEYNLQEVNKGLDRIETLRLPLCLLDIDGDGRLEIAYYCWSVAKDVGALPGVYRQDAGRWVSVAPQADRFSLRDLDGDGKLEVVTGSRYVGYGMGDDDVPRVWRWNGRQYQDASGEFPGFYADLVARYRSYVQRVQAGGESLNKTVWDRAIQKAVSLSSLAAQLPD
jgi:hypothetical protein